MFVEIAQAASEAIGTEASTGVVDTLGINWKIFLAQLVNFGIVLLVLRRFVYRPLLKTMKRREEKIAQGLADAEKYEASLVDLEKTRVARAAESRAAATELLTKAAAQAAEAKQALLAQAESAAQKLKAQTQVELQEEKEQMLRSARGELADLVAGSVEKIIQAKLDSKKDEELIKQSLEKL